MKAMNHISENERNLLLLTVFLAFIVAFTSFTSNLISEYNSDVAEIQTELNHSANYVATDEVKFGIFILTNTDYQPLFRFFIALLLLLSFFLLSKAKSLTSQLLKIVSVSISVSWFVSFYIAINLIENQPQNMLKRLSLIASVYDFILFSTVSILFFWQISILLRMLFKKLNGKEILP